MVQLADDLSQNAFLYLTTICGMMADEWVLYECGYEIVRESLSGIKSRLFREVCKFQSKPLELVVSSEWDSRHVYAKYDRGGVPGPDIKKCMNSGRWANLHDEPRELLRHHESTVKYTGIDHHLLMHTDKGRVFILRLDKYNRVTKTVELSAGLPAALETVHAVQGNSMLYSRLANEHVYMSRLHSECALELCAPVLPGVAIKQVCCGSDHVLLLGSTGGRVWSTGLNHRGQLGHGDLRTRTEPAVVEALDGLVCESLACGLWHSLALSQYGDVYSWGWNADGQLGHSADSATAAIPTLVDMDEEKTFKAVSCGSRHSAAVTACGQLFTWGWNGYGQLCRGLGQSSGPAPVQLPSAGAVVSWVQCEPWSTVLLLHIAGD